jgi:hypothetical protein
LDDDAKAFFTTAENFAQLQDSEPSSQRVDFDRSTGRLPLWEVNS